MKKQSSFFKMMALTAVLMSLTVAAATHAGATHSRAVPAPAPRVISSSALTELTPAQIEAAVEEYFASVGAFDVPRYVNNFAPDGVLEDPVGTPPLQGTQAIAAYIAAIIAPFSEIKHNIQEVVVCGHEAAVNWKLRLTTSTGKHITIDGIGVFNFNQEGKLQSVREFWDLAAFLAELQG